jgi:hypothetical protein
MQYEIVPTRNSTPMIFHENRLYVKKNPSCNLHGNYWRCGSLDATLDDGNFQSFPRAIFI